MHITVYIKLAAHDILRLRIIVHTSESDQVIHAYIQRHWRWIEGCHGYRSDIISSE